MKSISLESFQPQLSPLLRNRQWVKELLAHTTAQGGNRASTHSLSDPSVPQLGSTPNSCTLLPIHVVSGNFTCLGHTTNWLG